MGFVRRLILGTAISAAAVMAPALPASAGDTAQVVQQAPATADASWHNVGPYYSQSRCEFDRGYLTGQGIWTLPCEYHPVKQQWWFLAWY